MEIEYYVGSVADEDSALRIDTHAFNLLDFIEEGLDVDDTSASDEVLARWTHHPRGKNVDLHHCQRPAKS